MADGDEKLVRMALEIRRNLGHRGEGADAAAADHLRQFWAPQMRADFLALADQGALPPEALGVAKALTNR